MSHVVVIDLEKGRAIASLGLIGGKADTLKTVVDAQAKPWNAAANDVLNAVGVLPESGEVLDVATIAIEPEYRRTMVSAALLHAVWVFSCSVQAQKWVAILDDEVIASMQFAMDSIIEPINGLGSQPYYGSPASTPIVVNVPSTDDVFSGRIKALTAVSHGKDFGEQYVFDEALASMRAQFGVKEGSYLGQEPSTVNDGAAPSFG